MNRPTTPSRRAFTLTELIAVIVIIGGVAGALSPIVLATARAYDKATSQRQASERVSAAMDLVVRTLRQTPPADAGAPEPGIDHAGATRIDLADGARIELLGSTLWFTAPDEDPSPLCQGVTAFELTYLDADGRTDVIAAPEHTQRIGVRLAADGFELRTAVFLRVVELAS